MRWTLAASGGFCSLGENAAAYGEIVWSWRRDRGVYPACLCGPGNGDNQRRSPGRARISRKAIARGRPGCPGCTCQSRVRFFSTHCTRTSGCRRRPAFPAPSVWRRANEFAKLRRDRAVRTRAHVEGSLHLAPLAGRGRIASRDAIRVRGYRSIATRGSRRQPLTPTSPREGRGEGAQPGSPTPLTRCLRLHFQPGIPLW